MNLQSRRLQESPKVIGFLVLVAGILAAYEMGQWVLGGGIRGLGLHIAELVGIVVALAVLVRWRMGILLFLFWLTFEDLIRKYAGGSMKVFFIKDGLLAVVYAAFFFGVMKGREKLFRPRFWVPMVALIFLAVAQVFNPRSSSLFYGLLGLKVDFYYVPLVFLGYALLRSQDDLERFLVFSLEVSIVVALVGIVQSLGWKDFLNPSELAPQFRAQADLYRYAPGMTHALNAPPSVFVSMGRYANYLELMFTLALGVVAFQLFRRRKAKIPILALAILAVAIFVSGSKGALVFAVLTLVGMGAGLLWGSRNQPWVTARLGKILRRSVLALAAAMLLLVYIYPHLTDAWGTYYYETLSPDTSSSEIGFRTGRYPLDEFEKVFEYVGWQWGYGTGTASLGVQYVTRLLKATPPPVPSVENGFGDMLTEWGIAGPVLWLLMAVAVVVAGWRVTRQLASTPLYPLALAILWLAFWVLLPFTWAGWQTYQNYIVNAYLWALVGILLGLPKLVVTAGRPLQASVRAFERPAQPASVGQPG